MEKNKTQRNSAVELLRILAMLFIVCSHCSLHSGFPAEESSLLFNNLLLDWCVLGNLGVDIFMIISGYFMCENPRFSRTENGIRLLAQVWFYSILGLGIYLLTGHQFHWVILLQSLFPTVFSQYWFFTGYFVLLFFFPYINLIINQLNRRQLLTLVLTMMMFWCIIPTFTNQPMSGGVLCQFTMFYTIGAYFRKYPDTVLKNQKIRYFFTALCGCLMFSSSVVLKVVFGRFTQYFYARQSLLAVGFAIGLFSIAIYRKSFFNKWINTIAGCTFGIYLFHDHPLMRHIIWQDWLPKTQFYDSYALIAAIAVSVLIVMLTGTVIELIRKAVVKKPMENLAGAAAAHIKNFFLEFFCRVKVGKPGALH